MNMIIFAVILPLAVLIILGIIYGTKAASDGAAYTFLEQSFGALCTISICAGGLMGLPLVVSEYRERKILKRFQVTPVSRLKLLAVELLNSLNGNRYIGNLIAETENKRKNKLIYFSA